MLICFTVVNEEQNNYDGYEIGPIPRNSKGNKPLIAKTIDNPYYGDTSNLYYLSKDHNKKLDASKIITKIDNVYYEP